MRTTTGNEANDDKRLPSGFQNIEGNKKLYTAFVVISVCIHIYDTIIACR